MYNAHPQLLISTAVKKSAHYTRDFTVTIALRTFAQREDVASKETLVNWSKVVRSPSSRHLKAATIKSAGTGDCSSHAQTKYSESRSRKALVRTPNLAARSRLTSRSSVLAFCLSVKPDLGVAFPPSADNLSLTVSGSLGDL